MKYPYSLGGGGLTIFGHLTAAQIEWIWMNGWLEIAVAMNAVRRFLFSALTEAFVSLRSGVLWMPPLHNLNQRQSALYPVSVCKVLTVPQLRDSGLFYRSFKKKLHADAA